MVTVDGGEKLSKWVELAQDLGLEVEVRDDSSGCLNSVVAIIRRKQVEVENALDVYNNSRELHLHALRTFNQGKWTNHASRWSVGSHSRIEKLSLVPYAIRMLAED